MNTLSQTQKAETKFTAGHWPPSNVIELHLDLWYLSLQSYAERR